MNSGRYQASASRRGTIQPAVFDLGDQSMPAQFCDQARNLGTALTLLSVGVGRMGIQMPLQVFVAKAVELMFTG